MGKHMQATMPTAGASELQKTLNQVIADKFPIEEMPLTTFKEYKAYNEEARKANFKLKIYRYPIKQCPAELHPKQRIKFGRIDQPTNALKVHLSNHLIHFDDILIPGKEYDLPECVLHHLEKRGYPVWEWITKPDGSRETKITHTTPRFSLRTVYQED